MIVQAPILPHPVVRDDKQGVGGSQLKLKPAERRRDASDKPKSAGNRPDLSSRAKRRSRKIFSRGLSGHQDFLIGQVRRRGSLCNKCQPQVIDDPVHYGIVGEESYDVHMATAVGALSGTGAAPPHIPDSGCGRTRSAGCRSRGVVARNTVTKQSHGLDEAFWDHHALFVRS